LDWAFAIAIGVAGLAECWTIAAAQRGGTGLARRHRRHPASARLETDFAVTTTATSGCTDPYPQVIAGNRGN
jgi:hypothetical protein